MTQSLNDMPSWCSLNENFDVRQVPWALFLLYSSAQFVTVPVACDASRPCSQPDPVDVRVSTVFSESVVRARLLAVDSHNGNDTGLTVALFRVLRVIKGPRSARSTVFATDVFESDLRCIQVNTSCLVFVNTSTSVPLTGARRNYSDVSERVSRISPWSRKALKYVRMHICRSQYCSKSSKVILTLLTWTDVMQDSCKIDEPVYGQLVDKPDCHLSTKSKSDGAGI